MTEASSELRLYGSSQGAHNTILGQWLRLQRERKQLSTKELATAIGVSVSFLGMIERGERNIKRELLLNLCAVLKIKTKAVQEGTALALSYQGSTGLSTLLVCFAPQLSAVIPDHDNESTLTPQRLARLTALLEAFAQHPHLIDDAYAALTARQS